MDGLRDPSAALAPRYLGQIGLIDTELSRGDVEVLLRRRLGVEEFNPPRGPHLYDLFGINLAARDLHEVRFGEVGLMGADVRYANSRDADMFDCNLEGVDLAGALLDHANMDNAYAHVTYPTAGASEGEQTTGLRD